MTDTSRSLQQQHIRGSALLVLGRVLSLMLSMATTVVLVRVLTKADYGAFAYALTLAAGARVLLSLGQGRLLSRFMATYEERRDYPRMFGALLLTMGTIAVTSLVCIVAVYLFPNALVGSAVHGAQPGIRARLAGRHPALRRALRASPCASAG